MTTDTEKTPAKKAAAPRRSTGVARKTAAKKPETVIPASKNRIITQEGAELDEVSGLSEEEQVAALLAEEHEKHSHFHAFTFKGEKFYFKKVGGFEAQDYLLQLGRIGNPSIAWALSASYLDDLLGPQQMKAFRAAEPSFDDMKVAWGAVLDHMLGDLQELKPAEVQKVLDAKGNETEVPVPAIAGN